MWSISQGAGAGIKVRGMSLPPDSANDRRAVPRHIRDGEHDSWEDGSIVQEDRAAAWRRPALWILLAVLAALFAGAWGFLAN